MNVPYAKPARRPLQIFGLDPMIARTERREITLDVVNEELARGPLGSRIHVIDYDASTRKLYEPVDLDHRNVVMNDGLTPSESDPRFHQQMVYAVAMKTLENFEKALGRKLRFKRRRHLRIFPHAFEGANAFYDPDKVALLFGYFHADPDDPGPNLPGQTVFSCLSHDIIAHETTHALVDRLRPLFVHATNRDVPAFHEGFSDIVAIFQHFSFREVLADSIQQTRSNLRSQTSLVQLAKQFGYATGNGRALRDALDSETGGKPDPSQMKTLLEPHDRGSILVAAVFDAFFRVYQNRIGDLVRIATGGTGVLPAGDLHPDLVNRIAKEASKTAQNILTMCIRAFEYLPPVDVTFGDFLRAIVTSDFEMVPDDEAGLRAAMVEAFRTRGIYPDDAPSLAEDSLRWRRPEATLEVPFELFEQHMVADARAFDRLGSPRLDPRSAKENGRKAKLLETWARANAAVLGLDSRFNVKLLGFHTVFRVRPDGDLKVELVAQFGQFDKASANDTSYGGVAFSGGATVIAGADARVRCVVTKPMSVERRNRHREYVAELDRSDPALAWCDDRYEARRMATRTSFAALHRGLR